MSRCSSIGEKGSWAKGKHAHSPFSLQKQIPSPLSPDIGERVRPSRYPPQPKSRPLSFSAPVVSRHGELETASARRRRGGILLSRLPEPSGFAVPKKQVDLRSFFSRGSGPSKKGAARQPNPATDRVTLLASSFRSRNKEAWYEVHFGEPTA